MLSLLPSSRPASPDGQLRKSAGGFTLVEVMVASLVMLISYVVLTQTFGIMNSRAAASRLRTNARVVVERNIAEALSVPFTATSQPAILNATAAGGVVYDDDGDGDGQVILMAQDSSGTVQIKGVLTRIVTAVTNPEAADIRRVTFRVDYIYRTRNYSVEITTLRTRT